MELMDFLLRKDKISINSFDNIDEKIMKNIRRGRLIGVARSIIIDYAESFNMFNKLNEFELTMGTPDIRHYDGVNVYCPDDIRYVATLSEDKSTTQFIQVFFPSNSLYVVLDHILGGKGNGEYGKELSIVEKTLLDWYFDFYNSYKASTNNLYYESNVEMSGTFPIKPLFRGLNIIIAYIPLFLYGKVFNEIIIRTNLDILNDILETSRENPTTDLNNKKKPELFSIRKMSTDDELDDIVNSIVENR